jgi:hypothetical protein
MIAYSVFGNAGIDIALIVFFEVSETGFTPYL